jgi:general secretion pathway protein L
MEYLILQVDDTQLNVAHFGLSRRGAELIGAAVIPLDDQHALADAIAGVADKIIGAPRVILCLPATLFAQRPITLPFNDLRKVREVLPAHLQGEIALPVEELVLEAMPGGDGAFLALWARRSDIAAAITLFRAAGLEPQVVTSLPFALAQLPGLPPQCAVVTDNTLALLKNGRLSYYRAADAPLTEAMISSTLTALELSGTELPPCLYLLAGEESAGLDATRLPLPVENLEAPSELGGLFKNNDTFLQLAGLYAVAKACQNGTLPDFRQGDLAWTAGDVKLRKKLLVTALLLIVMVLLLFTTKVLQYRSAAKDLASLNTSIAAQYREVFPTRAKAVDEISEIKGEIRKMAGVEASGGYLDLLKKLAEAKGATINGLYEAELEGRNVRIKGDARSAQAVNEFRTQITPLLGSVELGEVKSRPDGTVTFSMTGTLKEGTK